MQTLNEYYTEDEACDIIPDYNLEALKEYLCGWDDAIVDGRYKKEYVDMFCNR